MKAKHSVLRGSRHLFLAVGIVAATCLIAVAAVTAASPFGAPNESMVSRMTTTSGQFPATAARIGSHVVSGTALGHLVAEIQANALPHRVSVGDAATQALNRLRGRWAMVDEAGREGVQVSEEEVTQYLDAVVASAATGSADARATFASVMAANGDADAAAYVSDSRVRAYTHDSLMMRGLVEQLLATNPHFDWQAMQTRLASNMNVQTYFQAGT